MISNFYAPHKMSWKTAVKIADKVGKKINAKQLVNMRIARGGCFVARYLLDIKKVNGIVCDKFCEVKIYDNLPYITGEYKL